MGADLALAHPLLDGLGQILDQPQPSRHPARAAIETSGQGLQVQAEATVQLGEKPALFEGRLRLRTAQRTVEDQSLDLAQRPHRRGHRVAAQTTQRAHPLVPVDHHIPARLARGHDHDRHLLAPLGQRAQQAALRLRAPHSQPLVAQVELVKLEIQAPASSDPLVPGAAGHFRGDSRPSGSALPT